MLLGIYSLRWGLLTLLTSSPPPSLIHKLLDGKLGGKEEDKRYPPEKLTRAYAVKRTAKGRCYASEVTCHSLVSGHEGVVELFAVLEEGGRAYLVMVSLFLPFPSLPSFLPFLLSCFLVLLNYVLMIRVRLKDFHPNGDLSLSLAQNPTLYTSSPAHTKRIFLQLLRAVQHLHSRQVYHRDLKPENILLADLGTRAVVADFGLSTRRERSVEFGIGSLSYMSPG